MVEDSVQAQLRFVAARLRADTLSPSEAADSLKHAMTELFKSRLMLPRENRTVTADITPNQRLRWDVGRLELALAMRNEFLQSLLVLNNAFPNQPQERLRRALEVQLRVRAIDAAASAQRWTPSVAESNLEIRGEDANLDAATTRLLNLSIMFDSLGAGPEGRKLIEAGARQAVHTLAMAQALVDRSRPFYPQTGRIAVWNGVLPFSFPALGVSDSLMFQTTLINQTTDMRTLAHDVAHALRFLRLREVDPAHLTPLVTQWEEIASSVARYERGDYTSTLGTLHRYIRESMTLSDLASCAAVASQPDLDPDIRAMDVFAVRRRQYYAAMLGRCGGNQTSIVMAYQRLRNTFSQRLRAGVLRARCRSCRRAGLPPGVRRVRVGRRSLDAEQSRVRTARESRDGVPRSGSVDAPVLRSRVGDRPRTPRVRRRGARRRLRLEHALALGGLTAHQHAGGLARQRAADVRAGRLGCPARLGDESRFDREHPVLPPAHGGGARAAETVPVGCREFRMVSHRSQCGAWAGSARAAPL